jgi:hypothetical protein
MSVSYPPPSGQSTFALLAAAFAYCPGARFTGLLGPAFFQDLADRHAVHFGEGEKDTYNPAVTLWAWLGQILSPTKSCVAAAARLVVLCCRLGRQPCSYNSGAYCKARAKLPEGFLRDLTLGLGQRIEAHAEQPWRWRGRTVKYADGALLQVPDTEANLQQFPQQRRQKKGLSSTTLRVVVLLAFATAALTRAAYGPYRGKGSGEMSLLLQIVDGIDEDDILVGDRYYGSYLLLALLQGRGADGCFRLPVSRQADFHAGIRLGEDDYLQSWDKPCRPRTVDKETWDSLPGQIRVRVLRVAITQPGFRGKEVYVVTTLTDAAAHRKEDIGSLYFGRWNVELDLRAIKQGLGLSLLSCQTPAMVRKEMWVHLLQYNLVRCAMAQAAFDKGLQPRQLSFAAAANLLNAFRDMLSAGGKDAEPMREVISTALAQQRVGNRPGRFEPREIKRRPRKYKELKKTRAQRRDELVRQQDQADRPKKKGGGKDRATGR